MLAAYPDGVSDGGRPTAFLTDELGFAWDNPEVAAEWPPGEPNLSQRDIDAPRLVDAVATVQRTPPRSST